jgi:6-phosphogluconolactonase (cycloisomerase 2 family)
MNASRTSAVLQSLFVICLYAINATAADGSQPLADGTYTITNTQSLLALDNPGRSSVAGTQMIQWSPNGEPNQTWVFSYDASNAAYLIANGTSGLFLSDIYGALDQQYQDSPANQWWKIQTVVNGFVIQNKTTGRVIDDPGGSMLPGVRIVTWAANQGPNQTWAIRIAGGGSGTPPPPAGPVVESVTLVSADPSNPANNLPVPGYNPIPSNAVLNLAALPSSLTILANAAAANSVLFSLDGSTHLDGKGPPLSLCGDNDAAFTYNPCSNITVGVHTLTVIPYGGLSGSGSVGNTFALNFTVVDQPSGNPPPPPPPPASGASRTLYAVNENSSIRGSITVYDIDARHKPIKTIHTVNGVGDVRGVAASAVSGKLYVSYFSGSGAGMIYCLNLYNDSILWNKIVNPGVDRLSISPDGQLLYVPTSEDHNFNYINILDANTGEVVRTVQVSNHSHDTQYPLSGPIFQETKASDGSGKYLYMIDPASYSVSRAGPYSDVLGPYAVDSSSSYVVDDVYNLWGMQVANIKTGQIVTAIIPNHPAGNAGWLHGIGWTADQSEVWENGNGNDAHVYVWDMLNPMAPVLKQRLSVSNGTGPHWVTFDIKGDYAYVAPNKNSGNGTEIFNVASHTSAGMLGSSEDLLEVDFVNGKISQVGDQYGIGR